MKSRLMPGDTPDHMAAAWAGCMEWAIGKPELRAAFEQATGQPAYVPPRSGLDKMIDDATGYGNEYIVAFIAWANDAVWGRVGKTMKAAPKLTPRQRQVLTLVAKGSSNTEVAQALGVSVTTVKQHLHAVFRMFGVTNRTAAALLVIDGKALEHD
jgi:DNA-binding NarL/FixJ family response regulator